MARTAGQPGRSFLLWSTNGGSNREEPFPGALKHLWKDSRESDF